MNLDKVPDLIPKPVADVAVWRDGRHDHRHAVAVQQLALVSEPQEIGLDLFPAPSQVAVELLSDPPGVEDLDSQAAGVEGLAHRVPNGGLAGTRQPREPNGECSVQPITKR